MNHLRKFYWAEASNIAILFATIVGIGTFALPYVFKSSGFLISSIWMLFLGLGIMLIQYFHFLVLQKTNGASLLSLVGKYYGRSMEFLAFLAIIFGLILTLTAYLILAYNFLSLISCSALVWLMIFWALASLPIFLKNSFFSGLEFLGAVSLIFLIFIIVISNSFHFNNLNLISVNFADIFLPFGVIFFALAGWTADGAIYRASKSQNLSQSSVKRIFILGPILAIIFYFIFVVLALALNIIIVPDFISGINWPIYKLVPIIFLGLILIWTSYFPIGLEVKKEMESFRWLKNSAGIIVLFLPFILYFFGFNFLKIISLVGGIFIALEYVFLALIIEKLLELSKIQKLAIQFLEIVFSLAALYEIFFLIR